MGASSSFSTIMHRVASSRLTISSCFTPRTTPIAPNCEFPVITVSRLPSTMFSVLLDSRSNTNVSSKLDFVSQKKGALPSRPCGDWSACSQSTHLNEKAHRCAPSRHLRTLQMRDACGMDDSKFVLKCSVAQATQQNIAL